MLWSSSADTLFERLAQGGPAVTSDSVKSFRAHGRDLLQFIFANDKRVLFPSMTEAKLYNPDLKIDKELLALVEREFTVSSCFADGTQLQTREATLADVKTSPGQTRMSHYRSEHGGVRFSLRHPDDQDIVLLDHLRRKISQFSGLQLTDEQLANFCSLSVQHGDNPSFKLLSLIKNYMTQRMDVGLGKESAYINPLEKKEEKPYYTRADAKKVRPRCSIKFKLHEGVLGFEQILHTGYTRVTERVSENMELAGSKESSPDEYQLMNILIQVFVPLALGMPVVFLALVITADRSLSDVMSRLFTAVKSGELGRVNLRPTVANTLARAPKATLIKTYSADTPEAFGFDKIDDLNSFYDPRLSSFSQRASEFKQVIKDMHRDIEVPEGVSFAIKSDWSLERQQEALLSNLRKMGFTESLYTTEQLLNLCILVSHSRFNLLTTSAVNIHELFRENQCCLSEPCKKSETQRSIMPMANGFMHIYQIYYTQVGLSPGRIGARDGICNSTFFGLAKDTPLISVSITISVPLIPGAKITLLDCIFRSHVKQLNEYVEAVAATIERKKQERLSRQTQAQTTPDSRRSEGSYPGSASVAKRTRSAMKGTGVTPAMLNISINSADGSPIASRSTKSKQQLFRSGSGENLMELAVPLGTPPRQVSSVPDSLAASLFGSEGSQPSSLFASPIAPRHSMSLRSAASAHSVAPTQQTNIFGDDDEGDKLFQSH